MFVKSQPQVIRMSRSHACDGLSESSGADQSWSDRWPSPDNPHWLRTPDKLEISLDHSIELLDELIFVDCLI